MIYAGSQAPAWEPRNEAPVSRKGKLELPSPNSQAGAWELTLTKILNLIAVTPEHGNDVMGLF